MLSCLGVFTVALAGCAITSSPVPQAQTPQSAQTETFPSVDAPPSAAIPAVDEEIWSDLQEGTGYVVLLRHAQTTPGTGDPPGFRLDDCATQRNLSAAGRTQAARIGQAFRSRDIDVAQVFSSQYCRCLETAELMNIGTVTPAPMLNSIFEDRSNEAQQLQQTRQQILNHRENAEVIVMVTHFANISAVSGISPQPGDAVVLQAGEEGTIEVVGQIQGM